jgi:hypothetical protein
VSASTLPSGKRKRPPNAIGRTKMLIASMYSGNSQIAFLRCFSSTFLDHGDLELPRQEHDRHHRQDGEPRPVRVAARDAIERRHHRPQPGLRRRPRAKTSPNRRRSRT